MKYNPDDATTVWPKGAYTATIKDCKEKKSRAGNEMLELLLEVYNGASKSLVYDYIVNPSTIYKLKKLAKAVGKVDEFNAGTFDPAKHLDEPLMVMLDVEESDDFGDKNKVKAYLPKEAAEKNPNLPIDIDPDVPF